MNLDDLITPALILDKDILLHNINTMAKKAHRNGVNLHPHVKTHKCLEIANLQKEYGATGITVATLGEATVFIENGFSDVTLAYPIIPDKLQTLIDLAQRARINVVTDHPLSITALEAQALVSDAQLNVLLKVDCGYHRCGVNPSDPAALKLAKQIDEASHLTFRGILTHAGHAYNANSPAEIKNIAEIEQDVMISFSNKLQKEGIHHEIVSIGSTPTTSLASKFKDGITEIHPGNYVFFDNIQVTLGTCKITDCALSVLSSVVSVQDSHIVVDAGSASVSNDAEVSQISSSRRYGVVYKPADVTNMAGAQIISLSQEHGKIKFTKKALHRRFSPGDHLRIIPNHSCLTASHFDHYNVVDDNRVIASWPIHRERLSSPSVPTTSQR
jgi:D-serine deaminase-like pyridoxal phosphate-dependent protein